jgi:S1-C subfamily serine protease
MGDPENPISDEGESARWPAPHGPFSGAPQGPPALPPDATRPAHDEAGANTPTWPPATGAQPRSTPNQPAYNQPPYLPPTSGRQPYAQPPYGQAPYGHSPYGQPRYGQPPYGQPPYGQPPYGQPPYGQPPYGQAPYGQAPSGQAPYGHSPYGQPPNGQPPYGPEQPYQSGPERPPLGPSRHAKGLRSAAAILVVAAAGVAGAGVSRVAWPSSQFASNAASPATTVPSSNGSSGNGGAGISPFGGSGGSGSGSSEGAGGPSDVSAIASKVDPAVVDINSTFNYNQGAEGAGTGIVLTATGLVLTNNHVIDGETKLSVTDVGNGETYPATVVGYDNTHDVALVQLQGASGLTTAKLAPSSQSMGEAVVAIGNAGGTGGTPTSAGGSITALHQSITANDELTGGSEQLSGLIEVNANVEAGDSGGPLVNASGEVVGMDTAASESFAFSSEGNQGFAIPLNAALAIARQIESGHGNATVHVGPTGFLGLLENTSDNQSFLGDGAPTVNGVEIENVVAGSPAQQAGIAYGDVVTAFDGHAVSTPEQLEHLMVTHSPGNKVTITWVGTAGQSHTTTLTLASGPPA